VRSRATRELGKVTKEMRLALDGIKGGVFEAVIVGRRVTGFHSAGRSR
jgi:hypothetical protein